MTRHTPEHYAALRLLARAAGLAGEAQVSIAKRLGIALPTLETWARADGYRRKDLKAHAAAEAEADRAADRAMAEADLPEGAGPATRALARAKARLAALLEQERFEAALGELQRAQKLVRMAALLGEGASEQSDGWEPCAWDLMTEEERLEEIFSNWPEGRAEYEAENAAALSGAAQPAGGSDVSPLQGAAVPCPGGESYLLDRLGTRRGDAN